MPFARRLGSRGLRQRLVAEFIAVGLASGGGDVNVAGAVERRRAA